MPTARAKTSRKANVSAKRKPSTSSKTARSGKWYKTLTTSHAAMDGSFKAMPYHGGYLPEGYPLPTFDGSRWQPGAWTPNVSPVEECERGYHLTQIPNRWSTAPHCREVLFVAEARKGVTTGRNVMKRVFESVRLVRPVTPQEYLSLMTRYSSVVLDSFPAAMRNLWTRQYAVDDVAKKLAAAVVQHNRKFVVWQKQDDARELAREKRARAVAHAAEAREALRNLHDDVLAVRRYAKRLLPRGVTVTLSGTLTVTKHGITMTKKVA